MSGPYRILYHHRIRAEDGQAMHVRELIGALREEGHTVDECALVPKSSTPGGVTNSRGGFWERLSLPRFATELMEIGYNRTAKRMLTRAIEQQRPDFIYERHALHLDAGLAVARRHGIPLLLEVNSPMVDEMTRLRLLKFPRRAARVEREVLGGADRVFPVTRVLADWLSRCGAKSDTCRVVQNAADPRRYAETVLAAERERQPWFEARHAFDSQVVIGFVGYMRDWHRLEFAVEALTAPELQHARLCLIGDGPALDGIWRAAREHDVVHRVSWISAVPPAEVPMHVSMFDIGIIPAINPYSSPLKLFDYFAAGLPVLAPNQPNVAETVADGINGFLFAPNDRASFRARLIDIVGDRPAAARVGAAGRARLHEEDWTWRGNARRVVTAFEELGA